VRKLPARWNHVAVPLGLSFIMSGVSTLIASGVQIRKPVRGAGLTLRCLSRILKGMLTNRPAAAICSIIICN